MNMDAADAQLLALALSWEVVSASAQVESAYNTLRQLDVNLAKLAEWAGQNSGTGQRAQATRKNRAALADQLAQMVIRLDRLAAQCREIVKSGSQ